MNYKDYYQIMGLPRGSSPEEIKRAYRKLARKYHPDVSKEPNAEEKFKEIQEAYEVLKDPEKRAAYEQLGSDLRAGQEFRPPPDWGKGFEFSSNFGRMDDAGFSDFFASLFGAQGGMGGRPGGGARARAASGEDHTAKIQIDLEDSFQGGSKIIELMAPTVTTGGRVAMQPRSLRVTIPAGVMAGQQIRLAGQGSVGLRGGRAGDLYLEIEFRPHPLFTVQQRDMTLTLPIAPWEAALGATVQAPTLGGAVDIRIPPNARSGQKLRLKGRGLPGTPPGDQYVVLQIVTPPADTDKAKELYQKMSTELSFDPRAELADKRSS